MVYNLQDLFPESVVVSGMMQRGGIAFKLFQALEKWTYASVTKVIAINEAFAQHVRVTHPGCCVEVIPNWVDTEKMIESKKDNNSFLKLINKQNQFIVLYAGNLGYLQNLELLLDAALLLKAEVPEIIFVLVGNGNQKIALVDRAQRDHLSNCMFMDFQPYEMLAHVYGACDLGVVPMRPGAGNSSIPSKTWNYLSCSKPVIACVEKDSPFAKLIEESRSGLVVSPTGAVELALAIRKLHANPELRQKYGHMGRKYVEDHFSQSAAIASYSVAMKAVLEWEK